MKYAMLFLFAAFGLAAADTVQASDHSGHCPPGCDLAHKVCIAVPDVKKISKTVYECKDEDFCLPKCPCPFTTFFSWCGFCPDGCAECEAPRCRRILIKKTVTKECPGLKCVPEVAPGCPAFCPDGAKPGHVGAMTAPDTKVVKGFSR